MGIFGKKFNKQGWYDTDNTALQCARMGKDKKAKRKNKMKMDRMGRKLRHTKGTIQHRKKDAKKGARKLGKTKNNKAKKKGKGKKKNAKKKRLREKEKLKKERDRKKL